MAGRLSGRPVFLMTTSRALACRRCSVVVCLAFASRGWRWRVTCPAGLTRWGSRPHVVQRASRPAPATHAFKLSWLKANLAFGRYDISHCSDAVHGSPFLGCAILACQAAVAGDLAGQVATKRVSGSPLGPFISGLLRSDTQRDRRSSWWWGDWEAGGRTSVAAGRVRAWLSLDAVVGFRRAQAGRHKHQQFSRRRSLVAEMMRCAVVSSGLVERKLRLGLLRATRRLQLELLQRRSHF